MPTIYNYLGIFFYFWSNEHNPIHVHVEYQGKECIAKIYPDGKVTIHHAHGKPHMDTQTLKKVEKFVKKRKDRIKEKWVEYHLFGKKPKLEKITRRIA